MSFDKVAVVYAPKDTLIARVVKRNGLSYDAAKYRVELQIDIEQKRTMADFVIDNSGDLQNLRDETGSFLEKIAYLVMTRHFMLFEHCFSHLAAAVWRHI